MSQLLPVCARIGAVSTATSGYSRVRHRTSQEQLDRLQHYIESIGRGTISHLIGSPGRHGGQVLRQY